MKASIIVLWLSCLTSLLAQAQELANERKPVLGVPIDTIQASLALDDSSYYNTKARLRASRARHQLDSGLAFLNKAIDSVNNFVSSPQEYRQAMGRLYARFDSTFLDPLKSKVDSLNGGIKDRVYQIERSLSKKKNFVDSVMNENKFPSIQDLSSKTNFSDAELQWPETPLSTEQMNLSSIKNLPASLSNLDEIPNPLKKVGDVPVAYGNDIKGFTDTGMNTDKILERFEKQLVDLKETEALKNGSQAIEKVQQPLEEMTEKLKDKEKLKEELKTRTKKQFVDHFAGHQDKIESEIKSMEKLQRKYHSVTDVRYLPKRRTNPEKGKPFAERLIIGTSMQIDQKDPKWTGIDISPYVGYKFSDRFGMALGGTYRVTFDAKTFEFTEHNKVYGFRTFGNYRIFNAWFGHLEFETLKMQIPPAYASLLAAKNYEAARWTPMAYVGIFKTFTINKHFQGQTQVLYNFLKVAENFHFNKFAFRCGFEYKIITKKK